MMKPIFFIASSAIVFAAGLPLPEAPVRMVIPDVGAFDKALTGSYRQALEGDVSESDPFFAAWRRTNLGSKLDAQWEAFTGKISLNWKVLQAMQPSSMGVALLNVGHLEAVMVIETPLASASMTSVSLPKGERKTHNGVSYTITAKGTADGSDDHDQRMGFAWAAMNGRLFLASSERALRLALDAAVSGNGYAPGLNGLACLDLNLDELRKDLYFKREFRFPKGPETGRIYAALRQQGGNLVEVRQGVGDPRSPIFTFEAANAAIAGWEPDGNNFWPTFRRAILEPVPNPSAKPLPAIRPLPSTAGELDSYLTDFTKPGTSQKGDSWEAGDLNIWASLLSSVSSYGYSSQPKGMRRMVFPLPQKQEADFVNACLATMARRHGRAALKKAGDIQEIHVGPGLAVLAIRRTGSFLWVAAQADHLKDVQTPKAESDLIRWAKLDLNAVRAEEARWNKLEGPAMPEVDRPLSDRVLGLLGWMPNTNSISVERRKTGDGWTETVVFGGGGR